MSFLSVIGAAFKKLGTAILPTVATVEHVVAPIAELVFPALAGPILEFDGLVTTLQSSIAAAEAAGPITGGGMAKNTAVVADFEAALAPLKLILADTGHTVVYDDTALQATINAFVAAYNAAATLKASIKVAPTAKP